PDPISAARAEPARADADAVADADPGGGSATPPAVETASDGSSAPETGAEPASPPAPPAPRPPGPDRDERPRDAAGRRMDGEDVRTAAADPARPASASDSGSAPVAP